MFHFINLVVVSLNLLWSIQYLLANCNHLPAMMESDKTQASTAKILAYPSAFLEQVLGFLGGIETHPPHWCEWAARAFSLTPAKACSDKWPLRGLKSVILKRFSSHTYMGIIFMGCLDFCWVFNTPFYWWMRVRETNIKRITLSNFTAHQVCSISSPRP